MKVKICPDESQLLQPDFAPDQEPIRIAGESVQCTSPFHMVWRSKDMHAREFWLQPRFGGRRQGALSTLKSQWNWKGVAQGVVGNTSLLFRRVGYTNPSVLISSPDPRFDNGRFYYPGTDDTSELHLSDGRKFTLKWLNFESAERVWADQTGSVFFHAARVEDAARHIASGLTTRVLPNERIHYLQAAVNAADITTLLMLAMLDFFLIRVEEEDD